MVGKDFVSEFTALVDEITAKFPYHELTHYPHACRLIILDKNKREIGRFHSGVGETLEVTSEVFDKAVAASNPTETD